MHLPMLTNAELVRYLTAKPELTGEDAAELLRRFEALVDIQDDPRPEATDGDDA